MLDGGYIALPGNIVYDPKSIWVIQNPAVDSSTPVQTDPGRLIAGRDAPLEAAVRFLLSTLAKHPGGLALPLAYPPAGAVPPPTLSR